MNSQQQSLYVINSSKINPIRNKAYNNESLSFDANIKQQNKKPINNKQSSLNESREIQLQFKKDRNSTISNYINPLNTLQSKRKTLQMHKYINQLARLQYQDKVQQVHTKFTKLSKVTVMKKIKAKNQIAQFEDQDQDENLGFDELIQFKFGKQKSEEFHFQNQEIKDYEFCESCDSIHNDHPQVHTLICKKKQAEDPEGYSPFSDKYRESSFNRIKNVAEKVKNAQYQDLVQLLIEYQKINKSTGIKATDKIINQLQQLKQNNKNDPIFNKLMKKVIKLILKK